MLNDFLCLIQLRGSTGISFKITGFPIESDRHRKHVKNFGYKIEKFYIVINESNIFINLKKLLIRLFYIVFIKISVEHNDFNIFS